MKMVKCYVQDCMLFKSPYLSDKILGVIGWMSTMLFIYAVVNMATLF